MPSKKPNAVLCTISRGGFSGERVFRLVTANGDTHLGVSPLHYCYTQHGEPLRDDQPPPKKHLDGKIAAHVLQEKEGGVVLVSLPDGAVVQVTKDRLAEVEEVPLAVLLQP